jgi:hypothetical protein
MNFIASLSYIICQTLKKGTTGCKRGLLCSSLFVVDSTGACHQVNATEAAVKYDLVSPGIELKPMSATELARVRD